MNGVSISEERRDGRATSWVVRWREQPGRDGRQCRKRCSSLEHAEALADLVRQTLGSESYDRELLMGYTPAPAWEAAMRDYRRYLDSQSYTPATAQRWVGHVRQLARYFQALEVPVDDPWAVTSEQLLGYVATLAEGDRLALTVSSSSRCVGYFYSWAELVGRISTNPGTVLLKQLRPVPIPAKWGEAVEGYEMWHRAKGTAPTTMRVRRTHLRRLAEHCSPLGPWEVGLDVLVAFMSNGEWSPETRRGMRASVATFYGWAASYGVIEKNPAEHLPAVKVPRARPRPIHEDVLDQVLREVGPRPRLMLMLAAYAGLRVGEIARLHSRDIDPGRLTNSAGRGGRDAYLHVTGKGDHERFVPLHPDLKVEITRWLDGRIGFLFPGKSDGHLSQQWVSKTLSDDLPEQWTAHTLRHRFASAAYAGDRDLRAVQELLGHASPVTTSRYTAVPAGALMSAVMAAGPRQA